MEHHHQDHSSSSRQSPTSTSTTATAGGNKQPLFPPPGSNSPPKLSKTAAEQIQHQNTREDLLSTAGGHYKSASTAVNGNYKQKAALLPPSPPSKDRGINDSASRPSTERQSSREIERGFSSATVANIAEFRDKRKCSTLHRESEISLEEYGPDFERIEREKLAELKRTRTLERERASSKSQQAQLSLHAHKQQKSLFDEKSYNLHVVPTSDINTTTTATAHVSIYAGLSDEELARLVISRAQELDVDAAMPERERESSRLTDAGGPTLPSNPAASMTDNEIAELLIQQAKMLSDAHDSSVGGTAEDKNESPPHTSSPSSPHTLSPHKTRPQADSDDEDDFMEDADLTAALSKALDNKKSSPMHYSRTVNNPVSRSVPSSIRRPSPHSPPSPSPSSASGLARRVTSSNGYKSGRPTVPSSSPRRQPVANLTELGEFERRLLQAKMGRRSPMPDISVIPWYHPGISRHVAECLLLSPDMKDGTYLMRDSVTNNDSLTVSVRCQNSVKHYRVEWTGKQFCFGLGKFTSVDALIEHFDNQPMISGDSGVLVQLCNAYPRGVSEPAVYEHPSIVVQSELNITEEPERKRWSERPQISRRKKPSTTEMMASHASSNASVPPPLSINSKEGFLTKLGQHRKNWKKRWFVLYRNELKYFNTRDDKDPLRTINLDDVSGVERDSSAGKPHCFRLITSYRTFFIHADCEEDAKDWIEILGWKVNTRSSMLQAQLSQVVSERQL